ncbi:MAG: endonuclease domain-containing protein [bacterium]|nr:endonuclease domain-containing protein [bacterium]
MPKLDKILYSPPHEERFTSSLAAESWLEEVLKTRGPKSGFSNTIPLRRNLRRDTTSAEKLFWTRIAKKQFYDLEFRRQHGIGPYIVDFYCPSKNTVIEIDGDTHTTKTGKARDKVRDKYIKSLGYIMIRYNNRDVLENITGVLEDLSRKIKVL